MKSIIITLLLATVSSAATLDIKQLERERVLKAADAYLNEQPITVTASKNPRSAGGPHDFSSEADYWWPSTTNPSGPYIQRDGMTNPDNFVDQRVSNHRGREIREARDQAPARVVRR